MNQSSSGSSNSYGIRMKSSLTLLLSACLALGALAAAPARLSIDLGLRIFDGEQARPARTTNRARAGERIALYVRPHETVVLYIIESNDKQARLVHRVSARKAREQILPPGKTSLKSGQWDYVVVAAPRGVPALDQLFRKGTTPAADWQKLEQELTERSRIELGSASDKPPALAANVRSAKPGAGRTDRDAFFKELKTYSGNGLLVRTFTFKVK